MAGSEEEALNAAVRLAPRSDVIVVLGPLMVSMTKVDGAASEQETQAVRK